MESAVDAVLTANARFYRAFAGGDLDAMDEIWARDSPCWCIHPGWVLLAERSEIMSSWKAIFGNPNAPPIRHTDERASVFGAFALVVCTELLERTVLLATNAFVREGDVWKLVHHHAAPVMPPAKQSGSSRAATPGGRVRN
jgi:ketosteroid isomerase-like protein